jgi:GDP-D-mannose dehydratase
MGEGEGTPGEEQSCGHDRQGTINQQRQMKHIIIGMRGRMGTYVNTLLLKEGGTVLSGVDERDRVIDRDYLCECVHGDEFDVMHVCISFFDAESYCKDVSYYMKAYPSKKVVLYSLGVPSEICERMGNSVTIYNATNTPVDKDIKIPIR